MNLARGRGTSVPTLDKEQLRQQWEVEDQSRFHGLFAHEARRVLEDIYRERERQLEQIDLETANLFNGEHR